MGTMTWTKTDNINRCASENCFNNAAWTMTSGGVSSDYCDECRTRIDPPPHLEPCPHCAEKDKRIAELEEALWLLVGDAEALLAELAINAPECHPITAKEAANLSKAKAFVEHFEPRQIGTYTGADGKQHPIVEL